MSEHSEKATGTCDHNWGKSIYTVNDVGPVLVCTICGDRKHLKDDSKGGENK